MMESLGYAIIIAILMGLSACAGAWFITKIRMEGGKSVGFIPFSNGWAEEEEKIRAAGQVKPANYDEGPKTAEEHLKGFKRDSYHEELRDATRK